jgi:phosphopantothenoylcysteine decarboxylase/phosphopantothenate--cysteine ligase
MPPRRFLAEPFVKILITAGPTREYLDDVRYLSNASTGRMGYALAAAARAAGHTVVLVHGPTSEKPPEADEVRAVTSAVEMRDAVAAAFPWCDVFIACAAVSDYRPQVRSARKIKRESAQTLTLDLVANPDIAAEMAARRRGDQVVICFALETSDGEANARAKLARKGADAIVLNMATAIGAEETEITTFFAGRDEGTTFRGPKAEAAQRVLATAEELHRMKSKG